MRPSLRNLSALLALTLALPVLRARGQVIVIDRRPDVPVAGSFEAREVMLDALVRDQVAEVHVAQTFYNPGSRDLKAEYLFPVPEEGGDPGLRAPGRRPRAARQADEQGRGAADLRGDRAPEARPGPPGIHEPRPVPTSVFPIPPGTGRKVTLRYTQVLGRDGGVVELSYPFGTQKVASKPIRRLELAARIESETPIKSLYSPDHDVEIGVLPLT